MRARRSLFGAADDRAEIGIGTMIVFIAAVLVAAIAAGVLIETSGKLQERSARTGNEATEQVSSNLFVVSTIGKRNATTDTGLKYLEFYVTLAPGAANVDIGQLRITIRDETSAKDFQYSNEANPDANEFNLTEIRDSDNSITSTTAVLSSGDYAKIVIDTAVNGIQYQPRQHVDSTFVPEVGVNVDYGFNTPASYGVLRVITLR